jgi:hypothetical protein
MILEECGPCPVLSSYTLPFTLQPRKKHGKTSVSGLQQLEQRAKKCIELRGEYVE